MDMRKKTYRVPKVEVSQIETRDIIASSMPLNIPQVGG